jgi:glycosyltransferase involved in cell wall biosynthesis
VLYAGQVSARKGSLVLARAARYFLTLDSEVHLVYAGGCLPEPGTPIEQQILRTVGSWLADRVHFLGQLTREQTLACMMRAAVFAFPALIDCFPLVVLEAMAAGLPVVFTRNPPGPEMIEDGITGLLADPSSPRDFAAKISRLLDDPSFSAVIATHARKAAAERFSLKRSLDATEEFYKEALRDFCVRTGFRTRTQPTMSVAEPLKRP